MAKLSITDLQKTIIDSIDVNLDSALAEGSSAPADTSLIPLMELYSTFTESQKAAIKDYTLSLAASLIQAIGVGATAGQSVVISYRKSDGVSNGTMTFTNGILTSST